MLHKTPPPMGTALNKVWESFCSIGRVTQFPGHGGIPPPSLARHFNTHSRTDTPRSQGVWELACPWVRFEGTHMKLCGAEIHDVRLVPLCSQHVTIKILLQRGVSCQFFIVFWYTLWYSMRGSHSGWAVGSGSLAPWQSWSMWRPRQYR